MELQQSRRGSQRLAYAIIVAWGIILLVGVAYGAMVQLLGSAYCEPFEGSSQYGELRWSVLPPGPTCTFTEAVHGFDEVRGPYPVTSVWLGVLVIGAVVYVLLRQRSRRTSGPTA